MHFFFNYELLPNHRFSFQGMRLEDLKLAISQKKFRSEVNLDLLIRHADTNERELLILSEFSQKLP